MILVTAVTSETGLVFDPSSAGRAGVGGRRRAARQADPVRTAAPRDRPAAGGDGRRSDRHTALGCGRGAIRCRLPAAADSWPGADSRRRMETLRVLVVDDETGMRLAIARVLSTFTVKSGDDDTTDRVRGEDRRNRRGGARADRRVGARHPPARPEAARHLGPRRAPAGERARPADAHRDDHRLRHARDGDRRDQAGRPRLPAQAVHAGRTPRRRPPGRQAPGGAAPGAAPGRREAPGPLPVHLGARTRTEGAARGDRGLPPDPQGRVGGHRSGRASARSSTAR